MSRIAASLESDRLLGLAIIRLFEVLGEAASRVSLERKAQLQKIPWSQVVAVRNRLIHGYDVVDYGIVWRIVEKDIGPLVRALEEALAGPRRE